MGDIAVYGPIQGNYICQLPKEHLGGQRPQIQTILETEVLSFSLGKPVVTAAEKDGYFMFKSKDENNKLIINEEERRLQTNMDKQTLFVIEEMYDKVENLEEKILLQDMIDEVEFKTTQTLSDRACLLTNKEKTAARKKRREEVEALELRTLGSNKSDRGLYRRFSRNQKSNGKSSNTKEFDIEDVKIILMEIEKEKEDSNMPECFVLNATSLDATLVSARELEKKGTIDIPADEYLKHFGLNGIPIVHDLGNYTDPMNIGINGGVKEVASGKTFCLNQSSLWHAATTNQVASLSQHSGLKKPFTAVVPIKAWNNTKVWSAYRKTRLGKLGISAHLRGTATPLPNDQTALTCATLMKTIKIWQQPTEAQANLMADLLDTMQFNKTKQQMQAEENFLKNPDEHIINEMSSELAPVAMILGSKEMMRFAGSMKSREMWRAVISNSIYWNVRRSSYHTKNRRKKQDVAMDIVNFETKTVNKELLKEFDVDMAHYAKIFGITKKFKNISPELFNNITAHTEDFKKLITPYDFELFKAVEVVKAHLCKKSSWRWNKKEKIINGKYPYFNNENDAWKWLENTIKRVSEKQEEREYREANKHNGLIKFFEACPSLSFSEFFENLQKNIPDEFNKFKIRNRKTKFCIKEVYGRLSQGKTRDLKEKLLLILFGRINNSEWNRGEFLRNDEMAEKILEDLIPILEEKDLENMSFDIEWLKEMKTSLKDKFAKHWYRTKGSRKKYNNKRPSFWAITGHTDPWSFLKTDKNGYETFKEKLKDLDQREPSQQFFYKEWFHLLTTDPTKEHTMGQKLDQDPNKRIQSISSDPGISNLQSTKADLLQELHQKLVSIYPYPTDYSNGFDCLLKSFNITANASQDTKENKAKISANWKEIVQCLLDKDEAMKLIHSIQEVFGLDETSSMAFTAFNFIRKKLINSDVNIRNRKDNLKALIKKILDEEGNICIESRHIFNPKGKERGQEFIHFESDHLDILEELLPMRYIELKKAVTFIYGKEHTKRMALTYHIIRRYADMKFTSMEAFKSLLARKSNQDETQMEINHEDFEVSVDFETNFSIEGENPGNSKKILEQILHDVKTKDNLILWLNQTYERYYKKHAWKPLQDKISKEDLEKVSVAVTEVWYGSLWHQMVHINFSYDKISEKEFSISQRDVQRLTELKNFFHLALQHAHQIIPAVGAFNLKGTVYEVTRDLPTPKERAEKLTYTIRELYRVLETDDHMREEAASIFSELGDLGMPYNRSEQILELLKSVETNEDGQEVKCFKEEDSLMISVEEVDTTKVRVVHCHKLFLWPNLEIRLQDLPENEVVGKIRRILADELVIHQHGLFDKVYDALVHDYIPGDLMSFQEIEDLMTEMRAMKDQPRSRLTLILKAFSENNGTVGGLIRRFSKFSKEYGAHYSGLQDAVEKISKDLNALASKFSEDFKRQKPLSVITSMENFMDFLKHSKGNCATIQNHPSMTKSQLYQKINNKEIKPGDQIWMWRKRLYLTYAHAGIYDATNTEKLLIHVQPRSKVVINKGGKIVCQKLDEAVHEHDKIFVVRCSEKRSMQEKILKNAFACILPKKLKFKYNAYHGSCQTFCAKVCGVDSLVDMNPEMMFTDSNWFKKKLATNLVGNPNASLDLVNMLQERIAQVPNCEAYENEELMDVCTDTHHNDIA